ncbi:cyclodeaminase/cyclohydrolase family protein [Faecalispora anaeroviscerum]|uniref:cyclodeaminase/cyclohydrolase family protein n=1 Tax=Faecalispora anaeroviscerum TaxID=2991836 RepID=UPI0024B906E9|nr:cyclodeaminase/cyclohydrolase family protein [Faecalispora anaeroviscerum]
MEMKDMTLEVFCATTASNEPAPGGGSVSALAGALAAALAEMVAQLTISKKGYEEVVDEMKAIIPEASALRAELLDEITRDSTSFNAYMEAMTLPKDTDEQKETRRNAMQEALKKAAEVPLHVAVTAAKIMPMAAALVKKGNANAVTDGIVAAMMTRTAVLGALLNVKINLGSIKDEAYVADMKAKIHEIEAAIIRDEAAVLADSPLK